jgi:7,8-dihydropterin-6-yl-methyl-4-(beta-D-ribofuranosyl)aminobenzene 5'-phosphate synthase
MKSLSSTAGRIVLGLAFLAGPVSPAMASARQPATAPSRVSALRIVVLSTMLAEAGMGEWGFAALVEADGRRILFDTGAHPRTVLDNAKELGIDLSTIEEVVLSHNHDDHTAGLLTLRRELAAMNPRAVSRVHVGRGIFWSRPLGQSREGNPMIEVRRQFEATGGTFVEHDGPVQLQPGLWLTGPVPRVHAERNWSGRGQVQKPEGVAEDDIPEDSSLVADTSRGLVLLAGCGHAGIVNALEYSRRVVRPAPLHAALGGFHLFTASDAHLDWTAARLREFGIENLIGAHCTGLEAVYRLRDRAGLDRATAVVGAVGARFELGKGIEPGVLAR